MKKDENWQPCLTGTAERKGEKKRQNKPWIRIVILWTFESHVVQLWQLNDQIFKHLLHGLLLVPKLDLMEGYLK